MPDITQPDPPEIPPLNLKGVYLTDRPPSSLWDISCREGRVSKISEYEEVPNLQPDGRLVAPSLCHAHIHLDKCFLLSYPKYADLEIQKGDFEEALHLTSRYCI